MAAPKDPNDKPKVTLDLDLKEPAPPQPKATDDTGLRFRELDASVKRPEKTKASSPVKPALHPRKTARSPSRTKPSGRGSRPLFIGAGLLITVVLVMQYLSSSNQPVPAPAAPPKMAAKPSKDVPTTAIPESPAVPDPVDSRDNSGLRDVGLNQLAPELDDEGNTAFAVRVVAKPVCHPADVEAMRIALGPTGSLLVSLEPMADGSQKPPVTRTISLQDIIKGTRLSLPVNLKETGVYGIYICSDQAGQRSCRNKPGADFNKIFNHQQLEQAANAVFYYQFTVLGLDYATVYGGMPQNIGGARQQLKESNPKRDWKTELDKAASMMRDVKSYPPTTVRDGRAIVLELPVAMVNPDGSCR